MSVLKTAFALAGTLVLAGCSGGTNTAPSTVTVTPSTKVVATPTSTAPPVIDITIPDVAGVNADIAEDQLEDLGLTEVSLASANPAYSVVVLARNWTVVSVEPAPGTVVKSDSPVILKVYKD